MWLLTDSQSYFQYYSTYIAVKLFIDTLVQHVLGTMQRSINVVLNRVFFVLFLNLLKFYIQPFAKNKQQ